jgi:hypothetical protein
VNRSARQPSSCRVVTWPAPRITCSEVGTHMNGSRPRVDGLRRSRNWSETSSLRVRGNTAACRAVTGIVSRRDLKIGPSQNVNRRSRAIAPRKLRPLKGFRRRVAPREMDATAHRHFPMSLMPGRHVLLPRAGRRQSGVRTRSTPPRDPLTPPPGPRTSIPRLVIRTARSPALTSRPAAGDRRDSSCAVPDVRDTSSATDVAR